MAPRKIVIASKFFPPGFEASGILMSELYESLKEKEFDVSLYTGQGKPGAGNDPNIITVPYTRHPKTSKWGRIREEHSFVKNMKQALKDIDDDSIVILSTAPPNLPSLGAELKKSRPGLKLILIVYDIYPDAALELGYISPMNPLTWRMRAQTDAALKTADTVIAISEEMSSRLSARVPGLGDKISVIHNWADPEKLYPSRVRQNMFPDVPGDFVKFIYTGNIGMYYDLEFFLKAAEELKEENCSFIFVGEGVKKAELQVKARNMQTGNIYFYPYFPAADYNKALNSADVLILSLRKGFEGLSVPSKFYSYLAVGAPVMGVISRNTDIARDIEDYETGYRVEPGDLDAFVEQARYLINDKDLRTQYGDNGLKLFKKKYTRKIALSRYLQIISYI